MLVGRRELEHRSRVAGDPVQALFGEGVEEGVEAVKLPLLDGIVFVIVAPGAAQGQAQPGCSRRADAVHHILRLIFFRDRPTLKVDHVVAIEPGGNLLLERGVGQQVSGQLLDREFVIRHVSVVGVDQPIAPMPHVAQAVDVVAVRVSVSGEIEPLHGHTLAVVRRAQKLVNALLVSVGRRVSQKGIELGGRRRQTGQVEGHPPEQSRFVSFGRGLQSLGLEARQDEVVDGVARPGVVLHLGCGGPLGRNECPVQFPFRSLINPLADQLDLLRGQASVGIGGRHAERRVFGAHLLVKLAFGALPGNDHLVSAPVLENTLLGIEPQLSLPCLLVGTVAGEAIVGENGPDFAVEVYGFFVGDRRTALGRRGRGAACCALSRRCMARARRGRGAACCALLRRCMARRL